MKKLRENAKISVAWSTRVYPAKIIYVVRTRFIQRVHFQIVAMNISGAVNIADEGTEWVRGWEGPEVEALAVAAGLR